MDYSLLLLLVALSQVQGFHRNWTSSENHVHSNLYSLQKQFKIKDFDNVFQHYRSDNRRREPRFISFQTKDENIEVEIDFAIPFLSIPVKRSLSGALGTFQNMIKGFPMANVNAGALLLTAMVLLGGSLIGGISRLVNGGSFMEVLLPSGSSRPGSKKKDEPEESSWWRIIDQIDKALLKYGFDTTACTQRTICWHVKNSLANIEESKASTVDHVFSGLSSSEWALELISGTAWMDGFTAGRGGLNCEETFPHCKLSPKYLEAFTDKIKRYAK